MKSGSSSFGTIRNNTALKLKMRFYVIKTRFGTIRNNTALKHLLTYIKISDSFGTIRNNTALKLWDMVGIWWVYGGYMVGIWW